MTNASIGGITAKRGDGGSPEVFGNIAEVRSLSELGQTNELVEATNFDSSGIREYISGLSDGQEMSLECNQLQTDPGQLGLIADVKGKLQRNIEVTLTDGTNTQTYSFTVVPLSWVITPSPQEINTISFTLKITGDITIV